MNTFPRKEESPAAGASCKNKQREMAAKFQTFGGFLFHSQPLCRSECCVKDKYLSYLQLVFWTTRANIY